MVLLTLSLLELLIGAKNTLLDVVNARVWGSSPCNHLSNIGSNNGFKRTDGGTDALFNFDRNNEAGQA